MSPRSSNSLDSVTAFLIPNVSREATFFFPFDLDTRMTGLAIVCLDRGIHAQFERFKAKRELTLRYSVLLRSDFADAHGAQSAICLTKGDMLGSRTTLTVVSDEYLPMRRLEVLLNQDIHEQSVHLYGLSFPDPLNPGKIEACIEIPRIPSEWESV